MATRLEIRTRARLRADQDQSTFPTDTQYNYLIDEAAREVWYDLIRSGWPISFSQASAAVGVSSIMPLASSFSVAGSVAFIRGVYYLNGGTYRELKRLNEGDRAAMYSSGGGIPTHYDVRIDPSNGIAVQTLPYSPGSTVVVEYVTEYAGFSNDAAVWPGPARSDEMIVLKAAIKGCRKEGNDQGARMLEGEYMQLQQHVQDMASWTNMRHSASIRDVGPMSAGRMPFDFDI